MPWNEPGQNNNNQDPWGNKRNPSPPDLDKIIGNFVRKVRGLFNGKGGGEQVWQPNARKKDIGFGLSIGLIVILLLWLLSGLFIVNPAEEAVVLRLGKYNETLQPGLHWYARFIDTKYLVDIRKIYAFSLAGDFLTKSSEQGDMPSQYIKIVTAAKEPGSSSDQSKNLVNVELNVQYRIADPRAYLFKVVNPDDTIQQVAAGALSDVIGTMKLDEVLTTGRESLSSGVLERVKQVLGTYQTGLEVVAVTLRKVQAPDQVSAAFSDVNKADQDKSTYIQQAQAYASKVVPLAQGVAARTLADANAYSQQVVLGAQANVAKYAAVLKAYLEAPEITGERMYLEAMETVLHSTTKVLVGTNAGNNLLYLPLDKLINQNSLKTPIRPVSQEITNDNN
jgi:membrane protease subunit HflK